ncbi:MAG TPA: prolyl oligopeptidase family serine peptidase, partial [Gemmatimonadales bacterium]|nr:prolyl oligopeptidase family serine peptidase [Gemmatimonadales bacterium]
GSPVWSPDGGRIAFVSNRMDHAFIGVYADSATPITWISPSFDRDGSPRWSPDGKRIAFIRRPGAGGGPDSILVRRHQPWGIWTADAATGQATGLWEAPRTLRGSVPNTHGGTNLHWAAGHLVFLSYMDGWPHLYSLPEEGGEPLLLTPGRYMTEYIQLSPDRRWLVFAGNTGTDPHDIDRRHVVKVPVDRAAPVVMTPGTGLEWAPLVTGDGNTVVMISATPHRPPLPTVMPFGGGARRVLAEAQVPADFPTAKLVTPKQVVFQAPDGTTIHGSLFEPPAGGPARKPAVIYVHGGPPRQMLLGWHYSDYYSNAYATNQYLASRGFVVLSVNYRLGIGYGYEFHQPERGAGGGGASEYQDVKAAGEWLARQPQVDPARIGVYGGSYGGYLVALALGRDSRLFAAGVDLHGVHDRSNRSPLNPERYELAPDAERAVQVSWESSPVAHVKTWKSPVLIIHGDDDRNVRFSQSTDLVRRLVAAGVEVETLVIVDDTHHWMRYANVVKVDSATAAYLEKKLMPREVTQRDR